MRQSLKCEKRGLTACQCLDLDVGVNRKHSLSKVQHFAKLPHGAEQVVETEQIELDSHLLSEQSA